MSNAEVVATYSRLDAFRVHAALAASMSFAEAAATSSRLGASSRGIRLREFAVVCLLAYTYAFRFKLVLSAPAWYQGVGYFYSQFSTREEYLQNVCTTGSLKKELPQACGRVLRAQKGDSAPQIGVVLSSLCILPPIRVSRRSGHPRSPREVTQAICGDFRGKFPCCDHRGTASGHGRAVR